VSDWVIHEPGRGVNGVADKDAPPGFRRELEALRGVDMYEGGTTKNPKIGEVWVAASK
jgi:hypothetical protein